MRISILRVVAAAAAVAATTARADFLGVAAMDEILWPDSGLGLRVCRVYAVFDDPDGFVFAVAGVTEQGGPLVLSTNDPRGFYQHPLGDDLPPDKELVHAFPELALDTFVTMVRSMILPGSDFCVRFAPGWPGFGHDSLVLENTGWFVTPDDPPCYGPVRRVLIAQLTASAGSIIEGEGMSVSGFAGSEPFEVSGRSFFSPAVAGDFDGDGTVGPADLMRLIDGWGPCRPCNHECPDTDADCDAGIDDLVRLLSSWGDGAP